ncbi:interstitial collagenase [Salvia divinorum]|uniref:Interstitial collagenase n=1 Tax=Salvia divinorum TaxID=28513 RepID=A0ABD1H424_SALDI
MALNPSFHFVCFLTLVSALCNANRNIPNFPPSPSPFHSNLASTITNFDYLKYLKNYGYMDYARAHLHFGASQVEILKVAILTFQMNFGLSRTGELNDETMFKMLIPRCGVSDITDGVNTMILPSRRASTAKHHNKTGAEFPSYYDFFKGRPRWPYTRLSYTYMDGFPEHAKADMEAAFERWANVSDFNFYENLGFFESDIVIGYFRGGHGDGEPFDGPRGVLAHAFPPDDGRVHFDADENWSFQPRTVDMYHFETVATHEIGHILGLGHSTDREAIMFPSLAMGQFKELGVDDIDAISVLYPPPF